MNYYLLFLIINKEENNHKIHEKRNAIIECSIEFNRIKFK